MSVKILSHFKPKTNLPTRTPMPNYTRPCVRIENRAQNFNELYFIAKRGEIRREISGGGEVSLTNTKRGSHSHTAARLPLDDINEQKNNFEGKRKAENIRNLKFITQSEGAKKGLLATYTRKHEFHLYGIYIFN